MTQHFRVTDTVEADMKLYNRKRDVNKNKIQIRNSIKWIRVEEYGSYLFKITYDEYMPFQKVNIYNKLRETPSLESAITISRLFRKTGFSKQPKLENLREQLKYVPDQHK
ncbi:unnamed protein product [Acanthoscelides obtectus]|uniref:Uncharacterized protein n=1 Tax=Acanthoscelides obtectus TaxID=200917 RepID=A0A9P0PDH3_ACAOB|nr:unnamed protein product [Acanthoscelides obtectus]CAK1641914.1 hypothetical protein AOBTE_LOCUS12720 [Acanthoscelides obtectus]